MVKKFASEMHRIGATAVISAVASLGVAAWLPSEGWAQAAGNQAAGDQAAQDGGPNVAQNGAAAGALQEVVVTAERRATPLQTTPISVVAVSGDELTTSHVVDLNGLSQVSPSLLIYNTGTAVTADIRGVGNSNQGGDEAPGVIVLRDGLPNLSAGFGEAVPFYDIADVEVLRGPQGTFSGDNSTGGALLITSQNPNFNGINGFVNAQVATYSDRRLQGAVNLPVTDTLAMRLAFNQESQGSFFEDLTTQIGGPYMAGPDELLTGTAANSATDTNDDPGAVDNRDERLSLLWKPTDNFQSLTKIELDESNSGGIPTQPDINTFAPLGPGQPCPKGEGTAPSCHNTWAPGYTGLPYVRNDWDTNLVFRTVNDAYSENLQYTLPSNIQLRLLLGRQKIWQNQVNSTSNDALDVGSYSTEPRAINAYNAEFDALSPTTGRLSWIAGISYVYQTDAAPQYKVNTAPPYSIAAPQTSAYVNGNFVWDKTQGVFGQVSWQFTHTLQLVVGAREGWDEEPGEGESISVYPNRAPTSRANVQPPHDVVPTGKIDLNWTPLPGQFFYAFAARGYKPGEENLGNEPPAHYETVNDYEFGWKGRLADGHVLTQVGGYYMQYFGLIESIFNPQFPQNTNEGNIPYSNVKGIEVAMQAHAEGFGVNLSGAYNKSVLGPLTDAATYKFPTDYGTTPQCAVGVTPLPGNANCTNYTPYIVTLSGEQLPYAPEFTANASIQYTIPLGDDMGLQPSVTDAYMSTSYASLFQTDNYFKMPSHSLYGAQLSFFAGPWTVTAYGTNLANTLYVESISGSGELFGNPRQYGLQLNRTF